MKVQASTVATAAKARAGQSNQPSSEDRAGGQSEDRFDPSRFRIDPAFADPQADRIPAARELSRQKDRKSRKFAIVPMAAQEFYPASARTLNLLAFLSRMNVPDLEGGWYKLTTGASSRFPADQQELALPRHQGARSQGRNRCEARTGQVAAYPFRPKGCDKV
jgi:hypothetical protein